MIAFLIQALPVLLNEHFRVPDTSRLLVHHCFDTMPTMAAMDGSIPSGAVDSPRVHRSLLHFYYTHHQTRQLPIFGKKRNPRSVSDSGTFQTASELECVEQQITDQRFYFDSWRVLRASRDGTHPKMQKTRLFCRVFFGVSWRADLNRRPADYELSADWGI
jgi:hypothetical protein